MLPAERAKVYQEDTILPVTWTNATGEKQQIGSARATYDFKTDYLKVQLNVKRKFLPLVNPTIVGGISIEGLPVLIGRMDGNDSGEK